MSRFANTVEVNTGNSVQMIRNDYSTPWLGILREVVQNSTDGWGENGLLESGQPLNIRFEYDSENDTLFISDNAGGMPETVLRENLVAIDNPSEAKADGQGAGSYGRGFWVVASCGQTVTVEVQHEGRVLQTKVDPHPEDGQDATYDDIVELEEPEIGDGSDGTFYEIEGVLDVDGEHLSDWPSVEEAFIRNFAPLLDDDRVTIEYVIDGEEHEVEGLDLNMFRENAIHEEAELESFSSQHADGSATYTVRDLMVIDATELEDGAPWNTVVGWKGNSYLDYPFMKVSEYRPYNVPSMSKPADMFGCCDVSELCPEQESNAHDSLNVNWGERSGLKERLEKLHAEHFQSRVTTEERNQLKDEIRNNINSILSDVEELSDLGERGDGPEGDVDGPENGPSGSRFFVCKTDARNVDVGERVNLFVELNFPAEPEYDTYVMRDVKVRNIGEDYPVRRFPDSSWDAEPNQPLEHHLKAMSISEKGRFSLSGKLMGVDENGEETEVDKSHTLFTVGDVTEPETEEQEDENDGSVQYVTAVDFFRSDESPRKAYPQREPDSDGIKVSFNLAWPEAQQLKEKYTGDEYEYEQRALFTRWGLDEVVNYRFNNSDWEDAGQERFEEYLKFRDYVDKIRSTHEF